MKKRVSQFGFVFSVLFVWVALSALLIGASSQHSAIPGSSSASPSPNVSQLPLGIPSQAACPAYCVPIEQFQACSKELEIKSRVPLTKKETDVLLNEFKIALKGETKALDHRQKFEMKELQASHGSRFKEFMDKERVARREYFKATEKGQDKRIWMEEHKRRREGFESLLKSELDSRKSEQAVRMKSLEKNQEDRMKEFKDFLERAERPPAKLWPQPGMQ